MPKRRQVARDVTINRRITRPLYYATQRWMAQKNMNLTDTIERALLGLPGMRILYEEESEAHDKDKREVGEEFAD